MGPYLTIIAGAIKFFNSIAQRLQQHHDEVNGVNAQKVATHEATITVLKDVSAPIGVDERDKLWAANRQKFGAPGRPAKD